MHTSCTYPKYFSNKNIVSITKVLSIVRKYFELLLSRPSETLFMHDTFLRECSSDERLMEIQYSHMYKLQGHEKFH